jgi:NAD-dependent dihydropyrimidine dehydrogenase PreA subunit
MAYVITGLCVGKKKKECLPSCPVDSIHEGKRQFYIDPQTCIDCGACQQACPVQAIFHQDDVPERWKASVQENADFFATGVG